MSPRLAAVGNDPAASSGYFPGFFAMSAGPTMITPRRSALFVPADNERALHKARSLSADVVILDLEDGVAPAHKGRARDAAAAALPGDDWCCREKVLRINGTDSGQWREDLEAGRAADAVLLPKVESPGQLAELQSALDELGLDAATWIMCETALGVVRLGEVLGTGGTVAVVVVGTSDLGCDLRIADAPGRPGLLTALGQCVLQARALGADILDGVHLDIEDDARLRELCIQGRALGFDGKTLIHPSQLAIANEVFAPGEEEVRAAQRIIEAWREARAQGRSVAVTDGRLVEHLHVRQAQRILEIAAALAVASGPPEKFAER